MKRRRRQAKRILMTVALAAGCAAVVWLVACFYGVLARLVDSNKQAAAQQSRLLDELVAAAPTAAPMSYDWIPADNPVITHAMGSVGGHNYTNSLDGFLASYARGQRVFEVDFSITDDLQLVCAHDADTWRGAAGLPEDTPFTGARFLQSKLYGEYTPLSCADLIALMAEYPDVYIITDTKYVDRTLVQFAFSAIVASARRTCPEALERIIPQIYNENMYVYVMEIHPFKSMIYTLYRTDTTMKLACEFCRRVGIGFITISRNKVDDADLRTAQNMGIRTAVHTVNNATTARRYLSKGATMVYSDTLTPEALRR